MQTCNEQQNLFTVYTNLHSQYMFPVTEGTCHVCYCYNLAP